MNDVPDVRKRHAVFEGELGLSSAGSKPPPNLSHILLRQFGTTVFSPLKVGPAVTLFLNHVRDVFGLIANPEMFRSYTRRVVASMHDDLTDWDRANFEFIRDTVCKPLLTLDVKGAVSRSVKSRFPGPTTFALLDFRPKALDQRKGEEGCAQSRLLERLNPTRTNGLNRL